MEITKIDSLMLAIAMLDKRLVAFSDDMAALSAELAQMATSFLFDGQNALLTVELGINTEWTLLEHYFCFCAAATSCALLSVRSF